MTWGIPGVGKTTFAKWLVRERGFTRVDSDYPNMASALDALWARARQGRVTPEAFVREAHRHGQVIVELGIYAYPQAFDFLRGFRAAGADLWWFDGDRDEAFKAWLKDAAERGMAREKWEQVVRIIRANWAHIEDFFGDHIVRTIEAGPVHVPPEQTNRAIFGTEGQIVSPP
jgi:murein L,D-transpeptidase YcbB/YkuD